MFFSFLKNAGGSRNAEGVEPRGTSRAVFLLEHLISIRIMRNVGILLCLPASYPSVPTARSLFGVTPPSP
jgi:hypothetical protein